MRASEFITERKKKKSSRSTGGYFFPGYGYYGSGESGEGGGDGGGESVNRGMAEGATVTRIDSKPVTDFASGLKAYKHTDNWSQSGLDTGDDSYWKNKNLKTNTTKGLFAGDPRRTALYATGNAHETRYVEFTQNGQPIVYFDQKDLPAMRSRKTYLTVFDASDFRQLPTGEWFSENPGKPIKQVPIGDPFKYIASQGWIVRVTDDLDKVFKQVKNMHKAGKIAQYGAEGMNESQQGVAEGSEQISEYRDRLLQYVKSLLPNYPEYVLKDWLIPNKGDFSNLPDTDLKNGIMEKLKGAGLTPNTKWQLVPDMKFTMDMFEPMTTKRLIGRAGGNSDMGMGIPRDKERHATQAALAQQQGGVRKEPVLLIKTDKGYELLEGWHRTIQHFAKYPDGYTGPAYVAVAQGQQDIAENFADGRNPQDKGDSARHGIPKGATMAQLEKAAKAPGRKGQLARWQLNMRRGHKK